MIGIICALTKEAELLKNSMTGCKTEVAGGSEYSVGTLCGQKTVIAVCGVGKVFAAMCTQTMILKYSPSLIINTGVGGTLTNKLHCGDILVASSVLQHDMDTSPLGDPKGLISGINRIYFECDTEAYNGISKTAKTLGLNFKTGRIASGDKFIASKSAKESIVDEFGADVCDMESGAIGHVCFVNGTPFAIVRAISDEADGDASMDYPTFMAKAADNASKLVREFILTL